MGTQNSVHITNSQPRYPILTGLCTSNMRMYDCSKCTLHRACAHNSALPDRCACPIFRTQRHYKGYRRHKLLPKSRVHISELNSTNKTFCNGLPSIVPNIYHSIGAAHPPLSVIGNLAKNPQWRLNYQTDETGRSYVLQHCGDRVHSAYMCLAAGQLRADVFRFCAIWAEGGLYLDSDLEAVVPFSSMYMPCANASLGLDQNTGQFGQMEQKQMKILAGAPKTSIARCMLDRIVERVRQRWTPKHQNDILNLTGPALLAQCYHALKHSQSIALTYEDRRQEAWPRTGIVGVHADRVAVLAMEVPSPFHFDENRMVRDDYSFLAEKGGLYRETCAL